MSGAGSNCLLNGSQTQPHKKKKEKKPFPFLVSLLVAER